MRVTSCIVPSPLCGNLVAFVAFISKARIKITFSMKLKKPARKYLFFSVQTARQRCSLIAFPNRSPKKTDVDSFIVLCWVALLMLLCLQGGSSTLVLQGHLSTSWAKLGSRLISLQFVSVSLCSFTDVHLLGTGPAWAYFLPLARCAARNRPNTFRE